MERLRKYGSPPFSAAVIHGGPGAAGDMTPVARELCCERGILEPLQTEPTIDGQVFELLALLQKHASLPVTLVGHSWGAWLSFMVASKNPGLVKKLILIGSGPFEEKYVPIMNTTRLNRLGEKQILVMALGRSLNDPETKNKKSIMKELGEIISAADSYHPVLSENEALDVQPEIYLPVMEEALNLRKSGALLEMGKRIDCPVVAIHGDYDPHPFKGVEEPLSRVLNNFQMILLNNCGHYPWKELYGRDIFYSLLNSELRQ